MEVILVASTAFYPPRTRDVAWKDWDTDARSPADALAEFAGRMCYQSWNRPNPATRSNRRYLANILEQRHHSVLEHAGFTVAITGISRSCSHELVRHRHLSFSQLSQRYHDHSELHVVVPPLFRDDPEAMCVIEQHTRACEDAYRRLVEIARRRIAEQYPGMSRTRARKAALEAARCVLPNMTETMIMVSGNHRAWREFLEKRGSPHADAEMRELALRIFEVARALAPAIYQDLEVVCRNGLACLAPKEPTTTPAVEVHV